MTQLRNTQGNAQALVTNPPGATRVTQENLSVLVVPDPGAGAATSTNIQVLATNAPPELLTTTTALQVLRAVDFVPPGIRTTQTVYSVLSTPNEAGEGVRTTKSQVSILQDVTRGAPLRETQAGLSVLVEGNGGRGRGTAARVSVLSDVIERRGLNNTLSAISVLRSGAVGPALNTQSGVHVLSAVSSPDNKPIYSTSTGIQILSQYSSNLQTSAANIQVLSNLISRGARTRSTLAFVSVLRDGNQLQDENNGPPRPPVTYEDTLKDAFRNGVGCGVILQTLEIRHATFFDQSGINKPVRIVQNNEEIQAKLEAGAPVDAGQTVIFYPYAFDLALPESGPTKTAPEITINIDGVSSLIVSMLERAASDTSPIELTHRIYLSDSLNQPQADSPLNLTVTNIVVNDRTTTITARIRELTNDRFPRQLYSRALFGIL